MKLQYVKKQKAQLEQFHQVMKFKGMALFTFFPELKCKEQIELLESCIDFRKNPQYSKNAETPHCATIAAFWWRQPRRWRQRHCVKVREEGGFRNWFSWFFSREAAHYTRFWFHKDHFKGPLKVDLYQKKCPVGSNLPKNVPNTIRDVAHFLGHKSQRETFWLSHV